MKNCFVSLPSISCSHYALASSTSSCTSKLQLINMQIVVRFTCVALILLTSFSLIFTHKVHESGDILLGGLFPIHQKGM